MVRIEGVQTFRVNAVIGLRDSTSLKVPYMMVYIVYTVLFTSCMQIQGTKTTTAVVTSK